MFQTSLGTTMAEKPSENLNKKITTLYERNLKDYQAILKAG